MAMTALDQIFASDASYRRHMENGSAALAEACLLLQRGIKIDTPTKLIWSHGYTKVPEQDTNSQNEVVRQQAYGRAVEKQERAEAQRAMRDPCPYCGVRQDIGCKHVRHLFTATDILTNVRHVDAAWDREVRLAKEGK